MKSSTILMGAVVVGGLFLFMRSSQAAQQAAAAEPAKTGNGFDFNLAFSKFGS